MRRIIFLCFIVLPIAHCFCQESNNITQLTFIKNEAFIVDDSNYKLLIDYDNSSVETNGSFHASQSPFDNIDFISISHIHDDHYNKNLLGNYLDNNLECKILMPSKVLHSFMTYRNFESIKDRVILLNPAMYNCIDKDVSGNRFKYIMVPHAADISDMQNLILIFKSGHIKFLHSGDYWGDNIDSIRCNLLDEAIDVAMIHVKFLTKQELYSGIEMIEKYINPKLIILMHIPLGSTRMQEALNAKDELRERFSNIYVFIDDLKTIKIEKVGDVIKIK